MTAATFADAFLAQVRRRPDATAVVFGADACTYAGLDRRVAGMAAQLARAGVGAVAGAGDRVVLVADNSADHLAAAFAVWRAGAVLVTIYPSSTEAELASAIVSVAPALIVAGARVAATARAAAGAVPVVGLDGSGALVGLPARPGEATPTPAPAVDPDEVALICFTSGSTARPKAVTQSHRGLAGAATAYARVWHLGDDDATLVCLPMAWAFGLVTTSMAALVSGGRVVVLARAEPVAMLDAMSGDGVTFFAGVTTMFIKLVEALERDPGKWVDRIALRLCISGGEPRNESAFSRWHELTGCPVHDVYAASECFPVVTYDPLTDPRPRPGAAGRVVAEASLRVIGPEGHDVPAGGTGQAWTRGPALFQGYWGDPDLTAATLTPDGWYRTGDLVRLDHEGYVHVVGRASTMIIRGGANVSPAEVEAVLGGHPAVREVAVVGIPDGRYGEEVAAAVVLEPSATLDVAALSAHCADRIAGYKVPSRFVAVEQLPRNPHTGKVQRADVVALVAAVGGVAAP